MSDRRTIPITCRFFEALDDRQGQQVVLDEQFEGPIERVIRGERANVALHQVFGQDQIAACGTPARPTWISSRLTMPKSRLSASTTGRME